MTELHGVDIHEFSRTCYASSLPRFLLAVVGHRYAAWIDLCTMPKPSEGFEA
jgi:hypothetical protein